MEDEAINPNIKCHVCGENEFQLREGFYYCLECGVKQEQVRSIEVEQADVFNESTGMKRQAKTIKIKNVKAEKPQLTSWECYNYILRGFVEDLLAIGAKEELKLMALQVWAAYLRCMEVAFFNKKHAELPKLGVRYLKNDAETIYNHSKKLKKKRKRKSDGGDATSCASTTEEKSNRSFRKSKSKLDESLYSSMASNTSASQLSTSMSSAASNKAIKLKFTAKARKFLKKKMHVKHLERHETDAEGKLECHSQPTASEIGRAANQLTTMSIKQIYAVLGIALNLIGDEIQLSDLVRFIYEGHIGWKNVLTYFPENIASHGKELLQKINFYNYPEKYSEMFLRNHISRLCSHLNIRCFKTPSIADLVKRYVKELCLPTEIGVFAERLINFLPPKCDTRLKHILPHYEARAMAYIIFILKLLFGLDGQKEQRMSNAAELLNCKIKEFNQKNNDETTSRPLLFVWNEWVQFIEMRKIIVSQFNPGFCRQFKQCESATQIMDQMSRALKKREEQEQMLSEPEGSRYHKQQFETFRSLLNKAFEHEQQEDQRSPGQAKIDFKPTFTPALSYFKAILLHYDHATDRNIESATTSTEQSFKIPKFMRVNHADRDIHSFLEVKPIIEYFEKHQLELKVFSLGLTENRERLGIFRTKINCNPSVTFQYANFDISEENWADKIVDGPNNFNDDLEWKTDLESYEEAYFRGRMNSKRRKDKEVRENLNKNRENADAASVATDTDDNKVPSSIDLFDETNMDPVEADKAPSEPRRDLDKVSIFHGIEDEASLISVGEDDGKADGEDDGDGDGANSTSDTLDSSMEQIQIKSEFIEETVVLTPRKKRTYKLYISNMDCWYLLGYTEKVTKPNRNDLLKKFPPIFKWLIETCAQTLGVKWFAVFEQLLAIEIMFGLGVENLDKVENCVYLNYMNSVKDLQTLINTYRDIW